GDRKGGADVGTAEDDKSKPLPRAAQPKANDNGDSPAPDNIPQSVLVLRQLQDLMEKDPAAARKVAEDANIPPDELQNFVRKFQKPKLDAPRDGTKLEVKPGENKTIAPNKKMANELAGSTVSRRNERQAGMVAQDTVHGNIEGDRSVAPSEYRSR